ncbi:hypothetical protein GTR02_00300 [Kineococcus sp. R8]|uniref:DUF1998 domain-containing protein n=1 Tax=Kineococcus siccus TaxID=2696567 RepID=UPI001411E46A|nr:DUF1998 domain-containing protein [Kineococcus siccus]NAZ80262.1 hypothetical protein [Kineococcus siccus]
MSDLGSRSASQVLRTFLPQQTADLGGGIYRVVEWSSAVPLSVDDATVRRRLEREVRVWEIADKDGGFVNDLRRGRRVQVVALDETRGVAVERYPRVWLCPSCKRVGKRMDRACRCGNTRWGQLHFLGFHECGACVEPRVPRCPTHDDVQLVGTTSTKTSDLRFRCPQCQRELQKGLGFQWCPGCQNGGVHWNVHKARTAYTPRGVVIVNPPRPERLRELQAAGGSARALNWIVDGLASDSPLSADGKLTRALFVAQLLRNGMDEQAAAALADAADRLGQLAPDPGRGVLDALPQKQREAAEQDALDIALALAESRQPSTSLQAPPGNELLHQRYSVKYPHALQRAALAGIDLVERFPVLNVMYGYTRGGGEAGETRLVAFRHPKGDGYRLHGDLAKTEAYLIRLDPVKVAGWLHLRGHHMTGWSPGDTDPTAARLAILAAAEVPAPGDRPGTATLGSDLLDLVHSYAHRFMRQTAALAGIDRDALSEYLVPLHLGFFVYAVPRGEFVLGGMQAVFETDLDTLLTAVVDAERRCPLDPGCSRGSGACPACLHVGEPSCRAYNTHLERAALFGRTGLLG